MSTLFAVLLAAVVEPSAPIVDDFPPGSISPHSPAHDEERRRSYGASLAAMGEAPLRARADGLAYRLTIMPSFSSSMMVRLDWSPMGAFVTWKTTLEQPRTARGQSGSRRLTAREWDTVQSLVEAAGFWTMPPDIFDLGLDGTTYLVEGARAGGYHAVHRWSPEPGSFPRLARYLHGLAWPEAPGPPVVDPRRDRRVSIEGTVLQPGGAAPAAGVTVVLRGGGTSEAVAADGAGRFTFGGLIPGIYELQVESFLAGLGDTVPFLVRAPYAQVRAAPGEDVCAQIVLRRQVPDEWPPTPSVEGCRSRPAPTGRRGPSRSR